MPARLLQLFLGLIAYGVSMVMLVEARLGVMPWDVLHQGLALQSGWSMGTITIAVGLLVLLAWIPIRQKPGIGTIANVIVIGVVFDATRALLGDALADLALPGRIALLLGGIALNGVATAAYIGAHLGPGPRDGLMTGLSKRTGRSVRLVRTLIEGSALVAGIVLGGQFGVGTVLYALAIGPVIQPLLRWFERPARTAAPASPVAPAAPESRLQQQPQPGD